MPPHHFRLSPPRSHATHVLEHTKHYIFVAQVTNPLKATLNKVKNLNVQWLFNLEGSKTVQAKKLFKALDKDLSQHVTIQEFTDLLNAKKDFLIGK